MPVNKNKVIFVDKDFNTDSIEDVFLKYKFIIIDALQRNLADLDKDQPGVLYQSIDVKILTRGTKISFNLLMEDYWKYVDEGRKKGAKQPPQKAMLNFIKVRGITQYKKPDGTIIYDVNNYKKIEFKNKKIKKSYKQVSIEKRRLTLAYLIGRGIKKHGIKPTYFFSDVVNEDLSIRIRKDIEKALGREIELNFSA